MTYDYEPGATYPESRDPKQRIYSELPGVMAVGPSRWLKSFGPQKQRL